MNETEDEIRELQDLLDHSRERAGPHLLKIFTAERALSAAEIVRLLDGTRQVAVATVTAGGSPRVAPVDALFLSGRFHFGTHVSANRIRHLRERPGISLTYFQGDEVAVIVHGKAVLIDFGDPDFEALDSEFVGAYGGTPSSKEEGSVYVRVEPDLMFTCSRR